MVLSPLDHIGFAVLDYRKMLHFYDAALAPLNMRRLLEKETSCGYGVDRPFFWISMPKEGRSVSKGLHVAFSADSEGTVEAFYAAAIGAGATDYGAPGGRERYPTGRYVAFVLDPEGNNVEAIFRGDQI
ncbi:MAG: VOC family protein [Patescibacteria group bacterium]|nr:VOC family protein [Patescibacteria group bacterium]MDE1966168.1 VOC family protein [Patescibacteria group bacterium]